MVTHMLLISLNFAPQANVQGIRFYAYKTPTVYLCVMREEIILEGDVGQIYFGVHY